MCAMAAGKRTGVRSGNSSMFTIQRKKAIGKCWCAHAPEPALQKRKDCFCVNGLTRKFKKGQSFHHILASDADQITAGKKDRVSLHQCRFTSNQTRRYASFLLKLVRLNARKRCPRDLPESVSKTKRTSPLLNSPKSTFTFAIHLNL